MDKIESALRAQRKRIWLRRIKESRFAVGTVVVIAILLSWNIYRSGDRIIESEKLSGVLVGIHQVQSNLGSSTTLLAIKLNNGERVMVTAPANFIIKMDAKVEVVKSKTEQGSFQYYFGNYAS